MKRLTQLIRLILLLVAVASLPTMSGAAVYKYFEPADYDEEAQLIVTGKNRMYYVLRGGNTVEITVEGPTRLRVLSRSKLETADETPEYGYLVNMIGQEEGVRVTHQCRLSEKTKLAVDPSVHIGVSRKKTIKVPDGKHTYIFSLPKDDPRTVYLRFARRTAKFSQGTKMVAMNPEDHTSRVDLLTREEGYTYYRIGRGNTLRLPLNGPATLKVLSRIEYDQNMRGSQKWKLQIVEDGNVKVTHALSARVSEVTAYYESNSLVPSRAETFYVEIPEGEHVYEFRLPENHRTVLLRFLLPQSQLNRGSN